MSTLARSSTSSRPARTGTRPRASPRAAPAASRRRAARAIDRRSPMTTGRAARRTAGSRQRLGGDLGPHAGGIAHGDAEHRARHARPPRRDEQVRGAEAARLRDDDRVAPGAPGAAERQAGLGGADQLDPRRQRSSPLWPSRRRSGRPRRAGRAGSRRAESAGGRGRRRRPRSPATRLAGGASTASPAAGLGRATWAAWPDGRCRPRRPARAAALGRRSPGGHAVSAPASGGAVQQAGAGPTVPDRLASPSRSASVSASATSRARVPDGRSRAARAVGPRRTWPIATSRARVSRRPQEAEDARPRAREDGVAGDRRLGDSGRRPAAPVDDRPALAREGGREGASRGPAPRASRGSRPPPHRGASSPPSCRGAGRRGREGAAAARARCAPPRRTALRVSLSSTRTSTSGRARAASPCRVQDDQGLEPAPGERRACLARAREVVGLNPHHHGATLARPLGRVKQAAAEFSSFVDAGQPRAYSPPRGRRAGAPRARARRPAA